MSLESYRKALHDIAAQVRSETPELEYLVNRCRERKFNCGEMDTIVCIRGFAQGFKGAPMHDENSPPDSAGFGALAFGYCVGQELATITILKRQANVAAPPADKLEAILEGAKVNYKRHRQKPLFWLPDECVYLEVKDKPNFTCDEEWNDWEATSSFVPG